MIIKKIKTNRKETTTSIADIYRACANAKKIQIPYSIFKAIIERYFAEVIKMLIVTGKTFELSKKLGVLSIVRKKLTGLAFVDMSLEDKIKNGYIKKNYETDELFLNRHSNGFYYRLKWRKPRNFHLSNVKMELVKNLKTFIHFAVMADIIHSKNELNSY